VSQASRFLVVIDPTGDEQPAMSRAADVAQRLGASLDLLICYHDEYLSGDRLFDAPSLRSAREDTVAALKARLEALAGPLRKDGLTVATSAIWRHPLYEGIVWHAVQTDADIVFKDTHHHDALQRALFTNTDWSLIRTCPVPLWLVKAGEPPEDGVVLAAIDPLNQHDKPAALDDRILRTAGEFARTFDTELHAFHSYDPRTAEATAIGNAYIPPSLPYVEIESTIRAHHEKRVNEITTYHGIDDAQCHLVPGLAHKELPRIARSLPARLVVMGAVARNRVRRLFIGATAEQTLEHLPCDLLVVKPDWFETPIDTDDGSALPD